MHLSFAPQEPWPGVAIEGTGWVREIRRNTQIHGRYSAYSTAERRPVDYAIALSECPSEWLPVEYAIAISAQIYSGTIASAVR